MPSSLDSDLPGVLTAARYGKDLVRVCRVVREGDVHHVVEYTVRVMLEGEIDTSYTQADNTCVVATDTMKNTVYVLSKTSPYVLDPALFALHIALHFTEKYAHIHRSFVDIVTHRWTRIQVPGGNVNGETTANTTNGTKGHKHAFLRDGNEKQVVSVQVDDGTNQTGAGEGSGPTAVLKSGLKDLLVLKSTGSSFTNFDRDEYTTLPEVDDRIFSTSVTLEYEVSLPSSSLGNKLTIDSLPAINKAIDFVAIQTMAREITLTTFAEDESASVQATMYNTAQNLLRAAPEVKKISYSYPNVHYIPVNLAPFKLDNGLGKEGGAEVFHPVADPSGLITATITRK